MAFVKLVKNKAYYKRFQTKYRRRREGKTDYYARKRLIAQDKDKYDSKKFRLVARKTNQKIIAQLIYATTEGDKVFCSAESTELRRFGLTAGTKNYSAAYCTGYLLARRVLKQIKLQDLYKGVDKTDGKLYNSEDKQNEERRAFRAILDVGLVRTTTGNRVFGVLKGAVDGGISIPHNEKRFPGYTSGEEGVKAAYKAEVHRERIFGVHVDKYMKQLKKENSELFNRQFSKWSKCLAENKVDSVEKLYTKIQAEIRAHPDRVKRAPKASWNREKQLKKRQIRLNAQQRRERALKKIEIARKAKK